MGGDHIAVLGPIGEIVTSVGSGSDGAGLTLLVSAAASNVTSIGRVGRYGYGVVLRLGLEVSHQVAVGIDSESVASVGRDYIAVLGPVGEGIASIRRGSHCARLTLVVGAATSDRATDVRVGRNVNGVLLRTASSDLDSGDVGDFVVAEHGQRGGARRSRSGEGDVAGAIVDGGRAHDLVVTGQGGQRAVAVGGIDGERGRTAAHRRGVGHVHVGGRHITHGKRRVAEEEPELIGGQTLTIRVVLVKNLHVAVG